MPLNESQGNMYDLVTHIWTCVHGKCPHECSYCYVAKGRMTRDSPAYEGEPRFIGQKDDLGTDRTILVANTLDLFAEGVSEEVVAQVFAKMIEAPDNKYVIQTKDPGRLLEWLRTMPRPLPWLIVGTTIETDDQVLLDSISKAPPVRERSEAMAQIRRSGWATQTFVAVEPVLKFDPSRLGALLLTATPDWVSIGADSTGCKLPEPSKEDLEGLMRRVAHLYLIEVRRKSNLGRLMNC